MMINKTTAYKYLRSIVDEHQDPLTGEYNHCLMAEEAMVHFDVGLDDTDTQEDMHDWALEMVWFVEGISSLRAG